MFRTLGAILLHVNAIVAQVCTATLGVTEKSNQCVTFNVGPGTGCDWMCNYCSTQLGTNNYYFTDNVCTYQDYGCVGNPVASTEYTCCVA